MRKHPRRLIAATALLALSGCATVPAIGDQAESRPGAAHDRPRAAVHQRAPERAPEAPPGTRTTALDDRDPQIAHLDPRLRSAVDRAARAARADGIPFWVTSGWRSRAHQQRLLDEAIARYGSRAAALRYVSTPDTSEHVAGKAVDIGPAEADTWLAEHGTDYGLCQIYANEAWHFELATEPGGICPALLPDASYR